MPSPCEAWQEALGTETQEKGDFHSFILVQEKQVKEEMT